MKRLYILRHAHADMPFGLSDIKRPLSTKGHEQALKIGRYLDSAHSIPESILCSPAQRTRDTLDGILKSISGTHIEYPEILYNAPHEILLNHIHSTSDSLQSLMIIAHNPGIYELAATLTGTSSTELMNKLSTGYAPATLSIFDCPRQTWGALKPKSNTLLEVYQP